VHSGGSDIMSADTMTGMRGARWNRGGRRRDTPATYRRLLREAWSGLHLGMRESQGKSRRGTPTGERALQGARCASRCSRWDRVCRRSASFVSA